jgi:hypothetical protein
MDLQHSIFNWIQPYQASLKIRFMFSTPGPTLYPAGEIMVSPYSRQASHEVRLFTFPSPETPPANPILAPYDHEVYEKSLFYFQTVLRTSQYPWPGMPFDDLRPTSGIASEPYQALKARKLGTDECYDCTAARYILETFLKAAHQSDDPASFLTAFNSLAAALDRVVVRCRAREDIELPE